MAVLNTTSPCPTESAPSAAPTNARPSSRTRAPTLGADLVDNNHRLIDPVLLLDQHLDAFGVRGRHVLADIVGADGKLSVAAVDQDRELDRLGAGGVHARIHRRARRAA